MLFLLPLLACADTDDPSVILTLDASSTDGALVYEERCASCHGLSGGGIIGPPLRLEAMERYTDEELIELILFGQAAMPGFAATLSDQEVADVYMYLRSTFGG